jgi:hypothetical protein
VSGMLESRAAQRGEEDRQLADTAASRAHAGSATVPTAPFGFFFYTHHVEEALNMN